MKLNGYTVIAETLIMDNGESYWIILAHRPTLSAPAGHKYVVATMRSLLDTEWANGYYTDDIHDAMEKYPLR